MRSISIGIHGVSPLAEWGSMHPKQAFTTAIQSWQNKSMLTMNYTYRIDPDALQQTELLQWLETSQ